MPDVVLLPRAICYNIHKQLARGSVGLGGSDSRGKYFGSFENCSSSSHMYFFIDFIRLRDQCGQCAIRLLAKCINVHLIQFHFNKNFPASCIYVFAHFLIGPHNCGEQPTADRS